MVKLDLDIKVVNFILQTLGELPTKTNAGANGVIIVTVVF